MEQNKEFKNTEVVQEVRGQQAAMEFANEVIEDDSYEEDVALQVAVVGLGNTGTQKTVRAYSEGFNSFIINASVKDVNVEEIPPEIPCYVVGDGRGSGGNRNTSKEFTKNDLEDLFESEAFNETIQHADVVIVTYAGGGGYGSGSGPLLGNRIEALYPDKTILHYPIAPKMSEGVTAHNNFFEVCYELEKLKATYTIGDLSQREDKDNEEAFKEVDEHFVRFCKAIRGDYEIATAAGMIDERDKLTVLNQPGYFICEVIEDIPQQQLEEKTIQGLLIDEIKNSVAAQIECDKVVEQMAFIANVPTGADVDVNTRNMSEIKKYLANEAAPMFVNITSEHSKPVYAAIIATGLSMPITRVTKSSELVKKYNESKHRKEVDMDAERQKMLGGVNNASTANKRKILGKATNRNTNRAVTDGIPDFL